MPKTKKKRPVKNPNDANLLARSVIEAAIGEPLIQPESSRKPSPKKIKSRR